MKKRFVEEICAMMSKNYFDYDSINEFVSDIDESFDKIEHMHMPCIISFQNKND